MKTSCKKVSNLVSISDFVSYYFFLSSQQAICDIFAVFQKNNLSKQ